MLSQGSHCRRLRSQPFGLTCPTRLHPAPRHLSILVRPWPLQPLGILSPILNGHMPAHLVLLLLLIHPQDHVDTTHGLPTNIWNSGPYPFETRPTHSLIFGPARGCDCPVAATILNGRDCNNSRPAGTAILIGRDCDDSDRNHLTGRDCNWPLVAMMERSQFPLSDTPLGF